MVITKIMLGEAGRVVIPKPLRDRLHLGPGDVLELESVGENMVLRPVRQEGTLRKEKGMWVFYSGKAKAVGQIETDAALRLVRDERDVQLSDEA